MNLPAAPETPRSDRPSPNAEVDRTPAQRGTITVLQAGRALAALAVVAYHAAMATRDFAQALPAPIFALFEKGTFGVDFFFVLSGFIIVHAHSGDAGGAGPARAYAGKRLIRIFLPYLPVSLAMILLYAALPGLSASARDWSLLTSLTLIPTGKAPALAAAWTLIHELMFYALFGLSYFVRGFALLVALWIGLILAGIGWGLETSYAAPGVWSLLAPINAEFVAGMVAALAVRRLPPLWGSPSLIAGLAGIAAFFALAVDPAGPMRMLLGVAMAFAVAGGAWLELAGRWKAPAALILLGNASYAIYLVHSPVLSAGARIAGRFEPLRAWPICLAFCLALGVAAGLLYHLAYERPALARVRAWLRGGTATTGHAARAPRPLPRGPTTD